MSFALAHTLLFSNTFVKVNIDTNSQYLKATGTSPKLSDLVGIHIRMTRGSHMRQRNTPLRQIFTAKTERWSLLWGLIYLSAVEQKHTLNKA